MKRTANVSPVDNTGLPKKHELVVLEGSALAGAAIGAAAGAMAGPPGFIVGGAIGTAVGLMVGSALDQDTERASAHDRELDDAIGVTAGDLGAREKAAAGLDALERGSLPGVTVDRSDGFASVATLLRAEHARLDESYDSLLAAYRKGDWADVCAEWNVFEPALRRHMETEETLVFAALRAANAREADALAREHEELRTMLDVFGVNIELHALTSTQADELVKRLRAHGAREEQLLYPWIDASFQRPVSSET